MLILRILEIMRRSFYLLYLAPISILVIRVCLHNSHYQTLKKRVNLIKTI